MYVLVKDNKVLQYPLYLSVWRKENPNISLPENPLENQLNEFGIYSVSASKKPEVDYTKNVIELNPIIIDGMWTQDWTVIDASASEIQERELNLRSRNGEIASILLSETDWTQMPDVNISNRNQFIEYRAKIREIAINPPITVDIWPNRPKPVWII